MLVINIKCKGDDYDKLMDMLMDEGFKIEASNKDDWNVYKEHQGENLKCFELLPENMKLFFEANIV